MKKTVSLVLVLSMMAVAVIGFGAAANAQTLSNTEKALALINTFATGDTDTARNLLADGYIQHNLAYGTGAGEQVAFDIFRFDEDGKIAEHWDVMETIADQSTWQNQNGKF